MTSARENASREVASRVITLLLTTTMSAAPRTFPPLYKSSGNESEDRLAFFHVLERLKVRSRV